MVEGSGSRVPVGVTLRRNCAIDLRHTYSGFLQNLRHRYRIGVSMVSGLGVGVGFY